MHTIGETALTPGGNDLITADLFRDSTVAQG